MARIVGPMPPARGDLPGRCGIVTRFYSGGEYQAPCTLQAGHPGAHDDGAGKDLAWEEQFKARLERISAATSAEEVRAILSEDRSAT
jgi:hypothetical protein